MLSQSDEIISYCFAVKYFGVYFPAAAAAFSLCTIWCASSAASNGIICSPPPPATPSAKVLRTSRRVIPSVVISCSSLSPRTSALSASSRFLFSFNLPFSIFLQASVFRLFEQIFRSAPGKCHDGQSWIFVWIRNQRRAIRNEYVFHVMRLAVSVQHAGFRIGSHPRGANFMNNLSAWQNSERILPVNPGTRFVCSTHHFDDEFECLLHVFGLPQFVFCPLEVKAQHPNSPLVHFVRIQFAIGIRIRHHFASPGKSHRRSIDLPRPPFQLRSVAFFVVAQPIEHADTGHIPSSP